MSDVWLVLPTANVDQCGRCFMHWRAMGYRCAALCNGPAFGREPDNADVVMQCETYPGWGASINLLGNQVFDLHAGVQWIVGAGDDMLPDPRKMADEIAMECTAHFKGMYGVMQPAGDPWPGNAFDICGSPWIGRDFMRRWNEGRGAFWPDYVHERADEELCQTSMEHGLLWQRPDLIHRHEHYLRHGREMPAYMREAYKARRTDMELFRARRAAGFPGHQPLSAA